MAKLFKTFRWIILNFYSKCYFRHPLSAWDNFNPNICWWIIKFQFKSDRFKFEKLDPIKGFGRIFSVKGLVELIKSIAKVVLLVTVVIFFLWISLPKLIYLNVSPLDHGLEFLYRTLMAFIFLILIILLVIGIGDFLWSRHTWLQKLRMSHQDIKEESKENEGSPEVKARIRKLQIDASRKAAKRNEALENIKDATVVITNPSHFAVAIRYEPTENDPTKNNCNGQRYFS